MTDPTRRPLLAVDELAVDFVSHDGEASRAVNGVSFDVFEREIVAVVGESGSGKSVTAMSILGLLPGNAQVSGSITLADQQLLPADERVLEGIRGRRVAMIFQDPFGALDPVFTVGFQIREVLRRHAPELSAQERRARAVELLTAVELREPEKRARSYPHQLSGGQAQRVVIAMALACAPVLLIADEPTTALDVTVQREILDLLMRVRETQGTAVLIITHDMGVVADVADRVVVMRHGHVEETQPVDNLFAQPSAAYTQQLLRSVPRLEAADRATLSDGAAALTLDDVTVEYRQRFRSVTAVAGVSLEVARGEVVALVGESGSGKSTIGKAITGLAPVRSGTVVVDGIDTTSAPRREVAELKKKIGVVFQNPMGALDPRWTMAESIGEPLRVHGGMRGRALRTRVEELLDAVGLSRSWGGRYAHELSGGQRQRVAIARALALDPVLLIADEPTSALDVSVQSTVLDLFRRLQGELRFACLFISHDLAVVDSLADRIVVLSDSRIVEQGPRRQILREPQQEYTRRLLEAAPVPDPARQRQRRRERQKV
ncbi:dipeptide ABC transporter ATP-binding protein [Microbacterium marinilacus]|uniref:ABC transporter ATP-binding protein n=1 Tax=Microbacterium marinilacus TaxID=415209 RepID=A0ABP7BRL9_9MICO|nr:ABC transporter ATP-binding protein [Microbacterium marinilacus]MBY0690413.1 ABC transporter ATP-binding protein [Microbacterium marinilacus]